MLALSAGFAWSAADDFASATIVPAGVRLGETDLSGMTADEARQAIESVVAEPMMQPIEVTFQDRSFTFQPSGTLQIDVDAMMEQAFAPRTGSILAERVFRRVTDQPETVEVEPVLAVEEGPLTEWVALTASTIDTPAIDATMTLVADEIVTQRSAPGYETDTDDAAARLTEAMLSGKKQVALPVQTVEPAVNDVDLGRIIVVDLSERRLYLYNNLELEKTFGIAIGTAGHRTPRGSWQIINKRYMPAWSNPGSSWAASMPAYIPPGPSNPLGTRALDLDAPAIRIHGTTNNGSIGRAASHGCMRMHRWDIEELYDLVSIGTKVFIKS
jgi:lipoprotein-anchoring transpeptidase ErfK/SrfK